MSDDPTRDAEPPPLLEDDQPAAAALDQTGWLCDMLGLPPDGWPEVVSVARPLPSYDVQSVLLAIEHLPDTHGRATFDQGFRTSDRYVDVKVDRDRTVMASVLGTHIACTVDGRPAVIQLEPDLGHHGGPDARLVGAATDRDTAAAALDVVNALAREHSTWRRRPVVFDPTPEGVLRPLGMGSPFEPPAAVAEEVRRSIISPLEGADSEAPGVRLLLTGPTGSGKSSVVGWLAHALSGHRTTVVVPPRILASPDLVHLAFEISTADAPSVLVFDHVDLILGDRYSMRYPESLAELVSKLDDIDGDTGIVTIATATSVDPLDPVLLRRFDRQIELGIVPATERDERLRLLVDKHAGGDPVTFEALRSRSRGWVVGQLADLERLVTRRVEEGENVDLTLVAGEVGKSVVAGDAGDEGGSYL